MGTAAGFVPGCAGVFLLAHLAAAGSEGHQHRLTLTLHGIFHCAERSLDRFAATDETFDATPPL
jgi:hypothetical protein